MAVNVIDTIKPKGEFPVVEAVNVDVNGEKLTEVLEGLATAEDLENVAQLVNDKADKSELEEAERVIDLKANKAEVDEKTSDLQTQINNIVTGVPAEAEVLQARGEYSTLNERLTTENANIKKDLSELATFNSTGKNLFNPNTTNKRTGRYVNADTGKLSVSASYSVVVIVVGGGTVLSFNKPNLHVCSFSEIPNLANVQDYTSVPGFIEGFSDNVAKQGYTVPQNAKCITVSYATETQEATLQVEKGNASTGYEPYIHYDTILKKDVFPNDYKEDIGKIDGIEEKANYSYENVNALADATSEKAKNILDETAYVNGIIYSNGSIGDSDVYKLSALCDVEGMQNITIYASIPLLPASVTLTYAFYDSNEQTLGSTYVGLANINTINVISIPSTAKYFRFTIPNVNLDKTQFVQVQEGDTYTGHDIFGTYVLKKDTEIIAARGNNPNLGDRLANMDSLLQNKLSADIGKNIYNINSLNQYDGRYLNQTGRTRSSATMSIVVLPITGGAKISWNETYCYYCFTDFAPNINEYEDDVAIPNIEAGTSSTAVNGLYVPESAKYLVFSHNISKENTLQIEYGEHITTYEPYTLGLSEDKIIKSSSIPSVVTVGATLCDYTSVLEALKNTPDTTKIHVQQGTYDIIQEYKDFYSDDFWETYDSYDNHRDDNFYRGYWVSDGRVIECDAGTKFVFDYTGSNTNVKSFFSPFAFGKDATLKNAHITFTNTCRYAIHDDFAGYLTGNTAGVNTIERCVFDGGAVAIGGGMGKSNTYIIKDCIFLNGIATTNLFYHNNARSGAKNRIFVTGCYGNKGCEFRWYGESTDITECAVSNCSFEHISCVANSSGVTENENMVMFKFNCTENNI